KRVGKRLSADERKRVELIEADVLKVKSERVDCVLAFNFSYFTFKTRRKLKRYFKAVHGALDSKGLFLLDAYGGSDSFLEMTEPRKLNGFTYIWDQSLYNPVTGDVINYIHFKFPDGTEIKNAFTYEWRLWSLPELRELLAEAGFKNVSIYWEGTDEDGEGDGQWSVTRVGEACPGWIAYLVAEK
ncbi:MAG: class I SAM-dependent methyltransferase, partial [Planctomycetota bacterium]|nr:class I SAM-dependent methyltransferase [Planctomycetota bacterium]